MRWICPDAAALLTGAALLLGGCFPPDYGPAPFACQISPSCPEGYTCVAGVCRRPGALDAGGSDADARPGDGNGTPDGAAPDQGVCINPSWAKLPLTVAGVELERVWGAPSVGLFALGWAGTRSPLYVVLNRAPGGTTWSTVSNGSINGVPWDLWGTGSADLHLLETDVVRRFSGGTWQTAYDPPGQSYLNGVWSTATSGPFVVGEQGEIFVFDRTSSAWSVGTTLSSAILTAIWGPASGSGSAFFVASYEGRIYSCTAAGAAVSCSETPTPGSRPINRLWGTSAGNVFAVGTDRTVLRYDGAWKVATTKSGGPELYSVWGSGPTDVYAVGRKGTILRRAGGAWNAMTSGTLRDLTSIWGTGPRDVVAVGSQVMLELRCQ